MIAFTLMNCLMRNESRLVPQQLTLTWNVKGQELVQWTDIHHLHKHDNEKLRENTTLPRDNHIFLSTNTNTKQTTSQRQQWDFTRLREFTNHHTETSPVSESSPTTTLRLHPSPRVQQPRHWDFTRLRELTKQQQQEQRDFACLEVVQAMYAISLKITRRTPGYTQVTAFTTLSL